MEEHYCVKYDACQIRHQPEHSCTLIGILSIGGRPVGCKEYEPRYLKGRKFPEVEPIRN